MTEQSGTGSLHLNGEEADVQILSRDEGEIIKAHKSILVKCPYYEAIFKGDWLESQTMTLSLPGYSKKTIEFVLSHLYEPHHNIPTDADFAELVALSDMLGISSLLQLISLTLSSKFCHNFHRPCPECIENVPQCLQLATLNNLPALSDKCREWLAKFFSKTWNSRQFAALKPELRSQCAEAVKSSMTSSTAIDVGLDCQRLLKTLPAVKWSEPVREKATELFESCIDFTREHFTAVIRSQRFQSLGKSSVWDFEPVESFLTECLKNISENQCCLSYALLQDLIQKQPEDSDKNYFQLLERLLSAVERLLVQRVAKATKCPAWSQLQQSYKDKIMQKGFFSPINNPSAKSSSQNPPQFNRRPSARVAATSKVRQQRS